MASTKYNWVSDNGWVSKISIGISLSLIMNFAHADRCSADAEFKHAYPANEIPSKFKFKFRVTSDQCERWSCRGYVHYKIHYETEGGTSLSKSSLVRYTIPDGQDSVEITDETYPSSGSGKITVRDIEIGEITCSSP